MTTSNASGEPWLTLPGTPVDAFDALLVDLDGVVYIGDQAVPGAPAALTEVTGRGVAVAYVTNNAFRSPSAVVEHLGRLGICAAEPDVVTSGQAAAAVLARSSAPGAPVLVIGGPGLREAVEAVGLRPVADAGQRPTAVVQGFSPDLSWQDLAEACVAVRSGVRWIATNPDPTLPTRRGLAPGNGALVEVVRSTTGVRPEFAGKPFRPIIDEAVRRTGANRPLVVGDRLDTDVMAAKRSGLASMLVLSGVHGVADLLATEPDQRPDLLGADVADVLTNHRAPRLRDGWWEGGTHPWVRCRWSAGPGWRIQVSGAPVGAEPATDARARRSVALEVVRVGCAAFWAERPGRAQPSAGSLLEAMAPWTRERGWAG
jgi:glycerol-1-phosphatase